MMPIARFMSTRAIEIGNIIIVAERNMDPAALMPLAINVPAATGAPIGKIV